MRYDIQFSQMQSNEQIAICRTEKVYSAYALNGLYVLWQ